MQTVKTRPASCVGGPLSLLIQCGKAVMSDPKLADAVDQCKRACAGASGNQVVMSPQARTMLQMLPQDLLRFLSQVFICQLCKQPALEQGVQPGCCPRCSHCTHMHTHCSTINAMQTPALTLNVLLFSGHSVQYRKLWGSNQSLAVPKLWARWLWPKQWCTCVGA